MFFEATDSAYAEVQRVLQIMIPEIRLTESAEHLGDIHRSNL